MFWMLNLEIRKLGGWATDLVVGIWGLGYWVFEGERIGNEGKGRMVKENEEEEVKTEGNVD